MEEDKNYNRMQTDKRGCGWGWGQYSGDKVGMGRVLVGMGWNGYKIFHRVIL